MDQEDRYTRITLRIPKDMHAWLVRDAAQSNKSVNAEILARIQATYDVEYSEQVRQALSRLADVIEKTVVTQSERIEELESELTKMRHRLGIEAPSTPPE